MNIAQHTPGPWICYLETYPIMVSSQSENWPLVDELGNEDGRAGAFIANTGSNKANAILIAAAPELLVALQVLLTAVETVDAVADWGPELAPSICQAARAVTKAVGGAA